jgi:hypothetical protein
MPWISPIPRTTRPKARRRGNRRGRIIDRPYLRWCSKQPCCITGEYPATTHHVREFGSPKNDRRVIRLVARLHFHDAGMLSIERLAKVDFEMTHSVSIEAEIQKLRKLWRPVTALFFGGRSGSVDPKTESTLLGGIQRIDEAGESAHPLLDCRLEVVTARGTESDGGFPRPPQAHDDDGLAGDALDSETVKVIEGNGKLAEQGAHATNHNGLSAAQVRS